MCRWRVVLGDRERECTVTGDHDVCRFRDDEGCLHRLRIVDPLRPVASAGRGTVPHPRNNDVPGVVPLPDPSELETPEG